MTFSLPAVEEIRNDKPKLACESAAVGTVHGETVPEGSGTYQSIKTERAGKSYRRPYHDELDVRRKDPANCGRCGKPNGNGYRQCDNCRLYMERRRRKKASLPVIMDGRTWNALLRRVASLELSVARLQLNQRNAYKAGYRTAQAHERKVRYYEPPIITKQELATMNHAYDHNS